MNIRKKPGIICTLGKSTDSLEILKGMLKNGMNCARINTAYASIEDHDRRVSLVRCVSNIPIMMDIKGPQVRLKSDRNIPIRKGDEIMLGFNSGSVYFNKDFSSEISASDRILFENGTIVTEVIGFNANGKIKLLVKDPGDGNFHKDMGVNVPGRYLSVERLSAADLDVIDFSIENRIEYIALSFARDMDDINNLYETINRRKYLMAWKKGHYKGYQLYSPRIIAKIEDRRGITNLEAMLRYSQGSGIKFGVMIARGDMFVELPYYKVPRYQKSIIQSCKGYSVPVITATGLLQSMADSTAPTRAEVSDVANAVLDGSDALMLSEETSNSRNPVLAVKTLSEIIREYS